MALPLWKTLTLAVIQGITEFLPISSSGHLLIVAAVLSPDGSVEGMELADVTIVLHLGTLLSILLFYWQRVRALMFEDRRTAWMLIIGTIPAVAFGLPAKLFFEKAIFENAILAGVMLIVTGGLLIWSARRPAGETDYRQLSLGGVLAIGVAQACAILPGLSRSGTTIAAALRLGLDPRSAATFSFLLAIPAILGAGALETLSLLRKTQTVTPPLDLALGAGVAFIVGLAALQILVALLERGRLSWFAAWCIPVGVAVVAWQGLL